MNVFCEDFVSFINWITYDKVTTRILERLVKSIANLYISIVKENIFRFEIIMQKIELR